MIFDLMASIAAGILDDLVLICGQDPRSIVVVAGGLALFYAVWYEVAQFVRRIR